MALITTLMVLMLASSLMIGFFAAISADQRANGLDRDQTKAYAAAHAGLEKLTSDLASLFATDVSPSGSQITALTTRAPSIPGFQYTAPGGTTGSGYTITFTPDANGNPIPENATAGTSITAGPYQGFKGLITRYPITVTARSAGGAEVRLRRELQTVAVPVFQFGIFSETDLTFYAGDNFAFGGRVHTNGNLFLSQLSGHTLTLSDRVTAVSQVVRNNLSNGLTVGSVSFTGSVRVPTVIGPPATYRNLATNEGSVTGMPSILGFVQTLNSNWTNLSAGTYKSNIRTGLTGAKRLDLPLVSQGAVPIDLIRRPATSTEHTTNPLVYAQRYYSQASLRILLSDSAADITNLPTSVTSTPPVQLAGNWVTTPPDNGTAYGPVDATHPPIARSPGPSPAGSNQTGTTTASGSTASTVNINATTGIPAYFRIPATLTVTSGATTRTVTCTGRTASSFLGCTTFPAVTMPSSATVSGAVTSGWADPFTASTTTSSTWNGSSTASTINVASTSTFAPTFLFIGNVPVTCAGYDATPRFTSCSGLTAAPGSGIAVTNGVLTPAGINLIGGFLKIEMQNAAGVWTDVTMEILNLGIGAPNQDGTLCDDPTPHAVLRLQRLRDNGGGSVNCTTAPNHYAASTNPTDWWPNVLYDTREGNVRDALSSSSTVMTLGGLMHYIALDANNLRRWFAGTIGSSGTQALNQNGYIVYFSDRRSNRNAANLETAEFGWEDIVNPASSTGAVNNVLDLGEDFNGDGALTTYGQYPSWAGTANSVVSGSLAPLDANARPTTVIPGAHARNNRVLLFRRALKLINGGVVSGVSSLPPGFTVVSENPVYVQGNYNATSTNVTTGVHVPAAILADAITLLSNSWTDAKSFRHPNDPDSRAALTTGFRFAVAAGKGLSFPYPNAGSPHFLFGTDGGVGNFLRLLEDWQIDNQTINYRGSIISLFNSRQATGTFKCCNNVYTYSNRSFSFDDDFLVPALLPPGTPMFRDVNTLTFRQLLRPTQ